MVDKVSDPALMFLNKVLCRQFFGDSSPSEHNSQTIDLFSCASHESSAVFMMAITNSGRSSNLYCPMYSSYMPALTFCAKVLLREGQCAVKIALEPVH